MLTRGSEDVNLRPRFVGCRLLLGATSRVPQNPSDPQFGLSPTNRWQTERVNQILEDMLRAYVLEYQGSWDQNLPLVEFSYNNSYQESLKMTPFEVLYGRRCRTPLNWIEPGEKVIFVPNLVEEAEATVRRIQDNLKAVKSRQETYANKRRRPLKFEVGNYVYLRVSPMKA
jgi:hypothetical protein